MKIQRVLIKFEPYDFYNPYITHGRLGLLFAGSNLFFHRNQISHLSIFQPLFDRASF